MKILFYAPLKPISDPQPSGDREIARSLHQYFLDQGHEVEILSEFKTRLFYRRPTRFLALAQDLPRALKKAITFKPDIFFTYHMYYKAPDPLAPWLAQLFRKPFVMFEAMYSVRPSKELKTLPGFLMSWAALKSVDHVFTDKTDDYPGLQKILRDDQITYIPPSIDLKYFSPNSQTRRQMRSELQIQEDEILISCVAMLRADRKADGVKFLIDCLGELKKDNLKFKFVHIGGGEAFDEVQKLCELKLGYQGIMLGSRSKNEVRDILQASDVFAFPGIDEGFGLVYIEAQACGLPVVAFDNGGIPDAVDKDQSGFLTPLLDNSAYIRALKKLIYDTELRKSMSLKARKRVEEKNNIELNYAKILAKMQSLIRS